MEPFEVRLEGVGRFLPAGRVLYAGVSRDASLMELHDALQEPVLLGHEEFVYVPHVTIVEYLGEARTRQVWEELSKWRLDAFLKVRCIGVFERVSSHSWVVQEQLRLGDRLQSSCPEAPIAGRQLGGKSELRLETTRS